MRFRNRAEAGNVLAGRLSAFAGRQDVIVLALPRGGVPVAWQVASALRVPMDVFVVRKLGVPGQPELAMGAIASGGIRVMNHEVLDYMQVPGSVIDEVTAQEQRELDRRERQYRGAAPRLDLTGRTVLLIDDGLATGSTMRAAAEAVRQRQPAAVIVAVPVAPPSTCDALKTAAAIDDVVCAVAPPSFSAVGLWYDDFAQTTDEEVRELLSLARARMDLAAGHETGTPTGDGGL